MSVRAGDVFGRLTVVGGPVRADHCTKVPCRCSCGAELLVRPSNLTGGNTKSCGCLRRENCPGKIDGRFTGITTDPLMRIVQSAIQRCTNPQDTAFRHYGGRGICVHPEWVADPSKFVDYIVRELGPRPDDRYPSGKIMYTIDRIDNDGNYEPGNLRWATSAEQNANRRKEYPSSRACLR